jgi:hypothetical protein
MPLWGLSKPPATPVVMTQIKNITNKEAVNMVSNKKVLSVAVLSCFVISMLVSGCGTTIKTNVLMPGKIDQAAQFKSIAVMPFEGNDGKAFTSVVESTLAAVIVADKQYFNIVDRGSMDKVMNEMKLGMTGQVDTNTAAQVGKMVGAKGIYTGIIASNSVEDSRYTETRKKCSYYRDVTDSKGKKSQECARWYDSTVNCTRRSAVFSFTPKLIEVESSRIIFSNMYEGSKEAKGCTDGSALPDQQQMRKSVQEAALQKFRMDVAPYYQEMTFKLKDSTSDISSDMAKAKLKDGLKFAGNNRMDRACELWNEAQAQAANAISVLFNLGVCAETAGKPEEALALYKQIDKTLTKPDNAVSEALARVTESIEKRKKLGSQMVK